MEPSRSIDPAIMRVFQRFPDRYLSPRDVAAAMNYRDLAHIRMRLSRMVKSEKLKRVGHGRYMANAPNN
jgi:predicted transcriptional regulator of viral defense system